MVFTKLRLVYGKIYLTELVIKKILWYNILCYFYINISIFVHLLDLEFIQWQKTTTAITV